MKTATAKAAAGRGRVGRENGHRSDREQGDHRFA